LDPLGLAREPPREPRAVVQLPVGLGNRLAGLVGQDLSQVVARFADEGVPFEDELGAGAGADFRVGLEGLVGALDGGVDVLDGVVGAGGEGFVGAGVCIVSVSVSIINRLLDVGV
jgi:hypothetical protein